MKRVTRRVGEWFHVGDHLAVGPTDADDAGVRVAASGRVVGGPDDGEAVGAFHDLRVGEGFHVGPLVRVNVVGRKGDVVQFQVFAPPNMPVELREDVERRKRGEA